MINLDGVSLVTGSRFCGVQLKINSNWQTRRYMISNTVKQTVFHYNGFIFKHMKVRYLNRKHFKQLDLTGFPS